MTLRDNSGEKFKEGQFYVNYGWPRGFVHLLSTIHNVYFVEKVYGEGVSFKSPDGTTKVLNDTNCLHRDEASCFVCEPDTSKLLEALKREEERYKKMVDLVEKHNVVVAPVK